jgi:propionate CoA-transferase
VEAVGQVTFNGPYAHRRGQRVRYITERAVFELGAEGLILAEIAPGLELRTHVLERLPFAVQLSPQLKTMDARLFQTERMGLSQLGQREAGQRVRYDEASQTLFLNLEGLQLHQREDVQRFEAELRPTLLAHGKVRAVINYDRFTLGEGAAAAWFDLVERNTREFFSESVRLSSSALFRRRMEDEFARRLAPLQPPSV